MAKEKRSPEDNDVEDEKEALEYLKMHQQVYDVVEYVQQYCEKREINPRIASVILLMGASCMASFAFGSHSTFDAAFDAAYESIINSINETPMPSLKELIKR